MNVELTAQATNDNNHSLDGSSSKRIFDLSEIRADFPILHQEVNGHPLVYLDNAATTQKPQSVIDAISHYYCSYNSNVHRGAHSLSDRATQEFEKAREKVAAFIHSPTSRQVLWTRGTTEGINLVAQTWGRENIAQSDIILVSALEHHSNIVPWQMLAKEKGAQVLPMSVTRDGEIDIVKLDELLSDEVFAKRVKLIAVGHVSNALGTVNPIVEIVERAKNIGAKSLIDGAQSVAHFPVDVTALGCDFFTFSGHKLFGPTGIGVLWGREDLLNAMPPYHGGGEMIEQVSFSGTTYNSLPYKFEAGTPDIAGAIGLGAAIDYIEQFDRQSLIAHEHQLIEYTWQQADVIASLKRVGKAKSNAGVFSFLVHGTHPSDLGMLLDQQGVAIRTGHHCAQPLMDEFELPGTARASFAFYNSREDIDKFFSALRKVINMLV